MTQRNSELQRRNLERTVVVTKAIAAQQQTSPLKFPFLFSFHQSSSCSTRGDSSCCLASPLCYLTPCSHNAAARPWPRVQKERPCEVSQKTAIQWRRKAAMGLGRRWRSAGSVPQLWYHIGFLGNGYCVLSLLGAHTHCCFYCYFCREVPRGIHKSARTHQQLHISYKSRYRMIKSRSCQISLMQSLNQLSI